MEVAIEQAVNGIDSGNGEVGVVVVRDGTMVYAGFNSMNTTWDVTAHAEISALRHLSQSLQTFDLGGHVLYCTLQPCTMCTSACIWANIDRVVYGATRGLVPAFYFDLTDLDPDELVRRTGRMRPLLSPGVLAERCSRLYRDPRRTKL